MALNISRVRAVGGRDSARVGVEVDVDQDAGCPARRFCE
jgi:hypothetical protein